MTTTTASMGLTLPVLNSDPGTWDTSLNATINVIDLHDHTSGKGVRVPSTGIGINADLTYAGYSITNLRAAVYTAQSSFATALSTYVIGNDLYFRDGASNQIRLTASGAINIATTGGFTGDYIAASAAAYYDDVNETYRFLEAAPAPNSWSRVACGSVDLYEHASGITNRVRLSSPAALAASYEVTFPAALPGSTLLTQVSAAGVMTWSNTIANAVTMSASLDVGTTLGVTGAATLLSTLGVTGLITATAGLTAAANQHVTVSGTGRFKHGNWVRSVSPLAGFGDFAGINTTYVVSSGAQSWRVAIPMADGERFRTITFYYYGDGAADLTYTVSSVSTGAVETVLTGPTVLTNPAAAWNGETVAGLDHTISSSACIVILFSANAANIRLGNISYIVDHP